jgi:signal transduction protein with GAF and PtsI domain
MQRTDHVQELVRSAVGADGIESAALFVVDPVSSALELMAAAGIEGPARDGLVAAVRNPAHPINRSLADDGPTFDVTPMNPGGPALRSHLPLFAVADGRRTAVGVLAVAHDRSLDPAARQRLERLAEAAAQSIG